MLDVLQTWLTDQGVNATLISLISRTTMALIILGLAAMINFIARRYIVTGLTYLVSRTKSTLDDTLVSKGTLKRLSRLAPALVIYILAPLALDGIDWLLLVVREAVLIYMLIILMLVIDSVLNSIREIYLGFRSSRQIPIEGFIQALKIVLYFLTTILIISVLVNKTPIYLLSGIGAMTAVMMLIFRDAILGFVAGIQLAANKMVSVGDWIEMPKYGADGDILEVSLTTVKVQNWDKTITTIPTYALISESFKNWRGMSDSGGRRIKRAVNIDMTSIRFCDEDMLRRFAKIQYITEYIDTKKVELDEFNLAENVDNASLVNGKRMTNIGTFRAYVVAYLSNHPMINMDMTFLVRQLPPAEHGLPIEIYVFSKDQVWANYEGIQADIFDHILAVVPEFDLKIYQNPTGADFKNLAVSQTRT